MACSRCGSKEHATNDCPHEFFSTKCERCGSVNHAASDCPRGFFSVECGRCGSKEHATDDCPHEFFSTRCDRCGGVDHATNACPHGMLSRRCDRCGSKEHASEDCPQGYFPTRKSVDRVEPSSASDENGCAKLVGALIGIAIVVAVVIWLLANVVLPLTLLNSALILTIAAVTMKQRKALFASLAFVGAGYMLLDISNGWLSANFVNNVVKTPEWLTAFVYINAVALGISAWVLVRPLFQKAAVVGATNKRNGVLVSAAAVALICTPVLLLPIIHRFVGTPSTKGIQTAPQTATASPTEGEQNSACGESLAFLVRFRDMDSRRLSAADLGDFSPSQLGFLRNYIYARHGRAFAKSTYAKCFSQFGWYHVDPAYRDGMLNSIERANIAALIDQERTRGLASNATAGTFKGAWFEIAVPPGFTTTPSMKSSTSTGRYDSALFGSPDGKVEFYIFSPQWKGEPADIALNPIMERQSSSRSESSRQRTVTWFTIEAKDRSYTRTYQDTRTNDGSTRWVVGVKYADQAALDAHLEQYARFKKSLRQFAD